MSIDRPHFDGPISFVCDDCGEVEDTHCTFWNGAHAKARSHGWQSVKSGDDWEHLCPDCGKATA